MKETKTKHKLLHWSRWQASQHFGVTVNKISAGLKQQNIRPGADGKYSTKDIFLAITGPPDSLKRRAEEARYRRIIEEAAAVRATLEEYKRNFVPVEEIKEFFDHARPILRKIFQHPGFSDFERQLAYRTIDGMTVENLLNTIRKNNETT
jgi:hypothetical protein